MFRRKFDKDHKKQNNKSVVVISKLLNNFLEAMIARSKAIAESNSNPNLNNSGLKDLNDGINKTILDRNKIDNDFSINN